MAKIVWVEDDVDVIDAVVRPLERAHYTIEKYRTISEAKRNMASLRAADLILLDMISPPGDAIERPEHRYPGLDFLQELREVHKIKTPVVVFTVVRKHDVHEQLRRLGVADIINKPVRPSDLKARVEQALASPNTAGRS